MEVTIVAHDIGLLGGGTEVSLAALTRTLLAEGVRVRVIARHCDVPAHPGLTVHRVHTPARPFPLAYPLFALVGAVAVRRHGDGVVHTAGAIVPNSVDCATIHFCHAGYADRGLPPRAGAPGRLFALSARISSYLAEWGERWCYRRGRLRAAVAVSPGVARELAEQFPSLADRVTTIPHGVDTSRFAPDPAARRTVRERLGIAGDAHVAAFVGGDWERKGLAHAIDAVALTRAWHLLVVGRGHRETYQRRAAQHGITERVHFAGETREVPSHLAAADVLLLPTRYETFCLVAFEAAATGLPLLVNDVNGPDLLIEPGLNGEFLDGDVARTARLLDRYGDPELRASHGDRARQTASRFTWQAAAIAHRTLYERLAGGGGHRLQ